MKVRLDKLVADRNLAESREKARSLIMAGKVMAGQQRLDKPGTMVEEDVELTITGPKLPYVSRGGLKLEKALQVFPVSLEGKIGLDIGASTGGFVDCALQNRASKMYAVDVGYGQLDWKLRNDPRVVSMERTNARYLEASHFPEPIDFVTIDVAFISLTKILPAVRGIFTSGKGDVLALIKPQFEAGRSHVGKKGVVRDPKIHREVIARVMDFAVTEGFVVRGLDYSPIKGPEGNIEYLLWLSLEGTGIIPDPHRVVEEAQQASVS